MKQTSLAVLVLAAMATQGAASPVDSRPALWLQAYGPEVAGSGTDQFKDSIFRCAVGAGPKLSACTLESLSSADPAATSELAVWLEATPACLLSTLRVGSTQTIGVGSLPTQTLASAHYTAPDWDRAHTDLDEALAAMNDLRPEYVGWNVQGDVMLTCLVAVDGRASSCNVESDSSPSRNLGDATKRAAKVFRFLPAKRDCEPIGGAKIKIPIHVSPRP
ncbi:MAG TPA: energy transducer TonB [Caulobacteraceae bacterium]